MQIETKDNIGIIRFQSSSSLNALTLENGKCLDQFLSELSPSVKMIVLLSDVEKAFSAGIDLKEFYANPTEEYRAAFLTAWTSLNRCEVPIIAAIGGVAFGGGLEIALMADIIITSEKAIFAQPELTVGTIPGLGATQRLSRRIGYYRAADLVFSNRRIDATTALEWGLVSRVVDHKLLEESAMTLAKEMTSRSLPSLKLAKKALRHSEESSLEEGLEFEKQCFLETFNTSDQQEGFLAFIEKRAPEFKDR